LLLLLLLLGDAVICISLPISCTASPGALDAASHRSNSCISCNCSCCCCWVPDTLLLLLLLLLLVSCSHAS
jgi:hypothetical protein